MRKKILVGVLCAVTTLSMLSACGKDKQQIKIESWTEEPSISSTQVVNNDGVSNPSLETSSWPLFVNPSDYYSSLNNPSDNENEPSELPTSSDTIPTPIITESTIIVDNVGAEDETNINNTEVDSNIENQTNDSSSEGTISTTTP